MHQQEDHLDWLRRTGLHGLMYAAPLLEAHSLRNWRFSCYLPNFTEAMGQSDGGATGLPWPSMTDLCQAA